MDAHAATASSVTRAGGILEADWIFLAQNRKRVERHVYTDTQKLVRNLSILSAQGLNEAAAPPIQDRVQ